jgi:hypothetical protein
MTLSTPHRQWEACCEATRSIRARFGVDAAIDYLIGEKLTAFARNGESHPDYRAELPAFARRIRQLFSSAEILAHFARAQHAALLEPQLLEGTSAEEVAEIKTLIEELRQDRERRQWLKDMLLETGH